jgi:hypothetical protein
MTERRRSLWLSFFLALMGIVLAVALTLVDRRVTQLRTHVANLERECSFGARQAKEHERELDGVYEQLNEHETNFALADERLQKLEGKRRLIVDFRR